MVSKPGNLPSEKLTREKIFFTPRHLLASYHILPIKSESNKCSTQRKFFHCRWSSSSTYVYHDKTTQMYKQRLCLRDHGTKKKSAPGYLFSAARRFSLEVVLVPLMKYGAGRANDPMMLIMSPIMVFVGRK
ncbi:hypothetical protein CEXT_603601 [Caerostris extrusa]|uniref:Uncharacterized protein n=1 Tax=Caerostris extrusa TaxID=172846 RepID=A0AAV4PVP4_CAEEX|nr:hypothetical protein CEXT_603601 [Caerostris extrusa]